jgi:hypothetical protein
MKQKLEAAFKQFNYEERQQDFNLEHVSRESSKIENYQVLQVEDDWFCVDMI